MSNEQLVIHIQNNIDVTENMAKLWEQNQRFVGNLARRYSQLAEEDDLKQEGYLGLWEAVERYRPEKGVKFLTYAAHWIQQKMVRYIHNNGTVRIPVHENEKLMQYSKVVNAFTSHTGRKPTEQELSHYMDLSIRQVRQLERNAGIKQIRSLESPAGGTEDICIGDTVASGEDMADTVLDELQAEHLRETIWPIVDSLPENQSRVIRLRYQEGLTLRETGERIGTNLEAARQWESKALRELRKPSRTKQLQPFLTDYIETYAYRGSSATFQRTWTSATEYTALRLVEQECKGEQCERSQSKTYQTGNG